MYFDNVIIGAGITGLNIAKKLKDRGESFIILEQHLMSGGLLRNHFHSWKEFDSGIHLVNTLVKGMPKMKRIKRNAKIEIDGKFVNYPYQFGKKEKKDVIHYNYQNYLYSKFGSDDYYRFHYPYNRNFWGTDLDEMSADFCNTNKFPKGKGVNNYFYYPNSSISHLLDDLSGEFSKNISYGEMVICVCKEMVVTDKGVVYFCKNIYNTTSLKDLQIVDKPIEVRDAQESLRATTMHIYTYEAKKYPKDIHWIYYIDKPFVRISFPKNWTGLPQNDVIQVESPVYIQDMEYYLPDYIKIGKEIFYEKVYPAYVIPLLTTKENVKLIDDYCLQNNIINVGRFGKWMQEDGEVNLFMHDSILHGKNI